MGQFSYSAPIKYSGIVIKYKKYRYSRERRHYIKHSILNVYFSFSFGRIIMDFHTCLKSYRAEVRMLATHRAHINCNISDINQTLPSYHIKFYNSAHASSIWGLWCQKQLTLAMISNCIPHYSVGCNYLSLPNIPASGIKVPRYPMHLTLQMGTVTNSVLTTI